MERDGRGSRRPPALWIDLISAQGREEESGAIWSCGTELRVVCFLLVRNRRWLLQPVARSRRFCAAIPSLSGSTRGRQERERKGERALQLGRRGEEDKWNILGVRTSQRPAASGRARTSAAAAPNPLGGQGGAPNHRRGDRCPRRRGAFMGKEKERLRADRAQDREVTGYVAQQERVLVSPG
jgi:hypothetical protein